MNASASLRTTLTYRSRLGFICAPCMKRHLHATAARAIRDRPIKKSGKDHEIEQPFRRPRRSQRSSLRRRDHYDPVDTKDFKPFTEEELADLRKRYTPTQMSAIMAGEEAISVQDLMEQGTIRNNDPWHVAYEDDFARHHPVLDKPLEVPEANYDPKLRFKTKEEIQSEFATFLTNLPADTNGVEFRRFMDDYRLMVGKEEAERNPISYLAPNIPKDIPGLAEHSVLKKKNSSAGKQSTAGGRDNGDKKAATQDDEDLEPAMIRLLQQTGMDIRQIRRLRIKNLVEHRVVNQTKLGKIQSQYYLTVAGDQNGMLGIGEGKSTDPTDARQRAQYAAIRALKPIPRYEKRTIYGEVKGKCGAVELELWNCPPGYGLRCQHLIFEMAKCAGITDLGGKVTRARNKMNTIKAAYAALRGQRLPEEVARGLGRKLVDVRKVYYGGSVP